MPGPAVSPTCHEEKRGAKRSVPGSVSVSRVPAAAGAAVAAIVLAVKVAFYRKQLSWNRRDGEVREPTYGSPLSRYDTRDVDDELARLKREMGG